MVYAMAYGLYHLDSIQQIYSQQKNTFAEYTFCCISVAAGSNQGPSAPKRDAYHTAFLLRLELNYFLSDVSFQGLYYQKIQAVGLYQVMCGRDLNISFRPARSMTVMIMCVMTVL